MADEGTPFSVLKRTGEAEGSNPSPRAFFLECIESVRDVNFGMRMSSLTSALSRDLLFVGSA